MELKRKILITANTLGIGGIETSLLNLLKAIDYSKFEVTVVFRNRKGILLQEIPSEVKTIDLNIHYEEGCRLNKKICNKILNEFKKRAFVKKYKNKFDYAICFAFYCNYGAYICRNICKNSIFWTHTDFRGFQGNKTRKYLNDRKIMNFKKVIAVSVAGRDSIIQYFPELKNKIIVCENIVDYKSIIIKSKEPIKEKKDQYPLFVNVSRHEEQSKRLTRLIKAGKILKNKGYKFNIWLLGDGEDTQMYKNMVNELNLNDVVIFKGVKKNPYPYMKLANACIMCSDYEGLGMSNMEALALGIPVITTSIGNSTEYINDKNGIIIEKDEESLSDAMEKIIRDGFNVTLQFKYDENNKKIIQKFYNEILKLKEK